MKIQPLLLLFLCLCVSGLRAQDPFYSHFYNNEAIFNPAYVGQSGAVTFAVRAKTQWHAQDANAYRTGQFSYEESMPCSRFDIGASLLIDQEGAGLLTTTEISPKVAYAIPIGSRFSKGLANIRLGFEFKIGQRSIDFNRLTFLDQIDPLYGFMDRNGNFTPTEFTPGSGASSNWYTSPTVGVLLTGVVDAKSNRSLSYEVGASVHNWGGFISKDARQSASLNGLDNPLGERVVLSIRAEKPLKVKKNSYVSIRPQLIVQTQEGLGYLEAGASVSLSRNFVFGLYYHAASPSDAGQNSNWTSLQLEFGQSISDNSRVDFGFAFSLPGGGLNTNVRPPMELTAAISFGSSGLCGLAGKFNDLNGSGSGGVICPQVNSTERRKLYENIWYKDNIF